MKTKTAKIVTAPATLRASFTYHHHFRVQQRYLINKTKCYLNDLVLSPTTRRFVLPSIPINTYLGFRIKFSDVAVGSPNNILVWYCTLSYNSTHVVHVCWATNCIVDVSLSDGTRLSSRDIPRLYGDSNANVTVVSVIDLKNKVAYRYETVALLKNPALNITKVSRTAFTYV